MLKYLTTSRLPFVRNFRYRTAAVTSAMHLLTGLHSKLITATPIINHSCWGRHRYSPQTLVLGIVHDIIIIISIVRKHNKTFIIREKFQARRRKKNKFFFRQYEFNIRLLLPLFVSLCRLHLLFRMTLCVSGSGGLQNTSLIEIFEIKSKFAKGTCLGMYASRGVGGK